jgi:prophage antirepressor-like protein
MQLIVFNYHEAEEQMLSEIKTVEINDEIWFVASDVCKVLEIANARDAVSSLDDDEKLLSTLPMTGHENKVTLINESGLYNLIFTSKKSSAQMFRKWITKEVIPSIRRKGFYGKIDRTQLPNFDFAMLVIEEIGNRFSRFASEVL